MALYLISGRFPNLVEELDQDRQERTDKIIDLIRGQGGEFIAGYHSADQFQLILVVDLPFEFPSRGDRVAAALTRLLGIPFTSAGISEIWGTWRPDRAEVEQRHTDYLAQEAAIKEEEIRRAFEQARWRQSRQQSTKVNKSDKDPIRVLVVDDVADTRMNIRKLLSGEADVRVVGEASDGLEAIEKFTALTPDVITMCIAMPALDGLSATEEICRKHPWAKVIILSVQDSISYKRRAVLAGACDYLTKPAIGEELKSAIRRAAGRDSFTSEEAATK